MPLRRFLPPAASRTARSTLVSALRWADGTEVDPVIPTWWVVLANKVKDPDGSGLLDLYLGQLDPASVAGYGSTLLTTPPLAVPNAALLARFAAADVPSTPYAKAFDPTGNASQALIEADPLARGERRPLMTDSDWIGLQSICAD